MPKVPTYDSFQATPSIQPNVQLQSPDMPNVTGQRLQQAGEGMMQAGGELAKIQIDAQEQVNKVRVDDAMNQLIKARTDLQVEASGLKGRNALERPDGKSLPDEYAEKLDKVYQPILEGLNGSQKDTLAHQFKQLSGQFYSNLSGHMVAEQNVFRKETAKATIDTATSQAVLLWGDKAMREQSLQAIAATVDNEAAANGWDKTIKDAAFSESVSPMHAGIMRGMIQAGMATQAKDYYDTHSASMTVQSRAAIQSTLMDAVTSQQSEGAADKVWEEIGPKAPNDAVRIFDMEQKLREEHKDSPEIMKKGIDALRQRATAFNAQQSESNAQNISGVWKLVDSGTPMNAVTRSDAWMNLSDTQRHDIRKTLESEAATRASRAASDASRSLAEMQRSEKLSFMRNGDKFLTATDPDVLSKMSRAQVEAKRGDFGMEATQHLLQKWDTLQKPEKIIEAKMDNEDFNLVADKLGLKPFDKSLNENEKRALGTLKYRIEQVIDVEQSQAKRVLTRQEKMELMRREMAQTVTTAGWITESIKPVITLNSKDNVIIPTPDRQRILEKMKTRYQKTQDEKYAPTTENLKHWYLLEKSSSANVIGGDK